MDRPRRQPPTRAERLALEVAAGDPSLVAALGGAIASSPRVREFVAANASKIRRKLRDAGDPESRRDVRSELRVALALAASRLFVVAWEPAGTRAGGPDFEVAWRVNTRIALEVTRRRGTADAGSVLAAVIGKLHQLRPSMPNVLVVAVDGVPAGTDLDAAFAALRRKVDARDPATLASLHARSPRDVHARLDRLAAVVVIADGGGGAPGGSPAVWRNPNARHALPPQALSAIVAAVA